ncbi:MAG: hypothetical protein AAGB46_05505 [Verrucomicrobiota bacterium]
MPATLTILYIVLILTGFVLIPLLPATRNRNFSLSSKRSASKMGAPIWTLLSAAIILGIFTAYYYRNSLGQIDVGQVLKGLWMLLAIFAGILAQILVSNKKSNRPLTAFQKGETLFAVLVACLVFYPIWAMNEESSNTLAWLYSAFLSGYGWESTIEKTPKPS